MKKQHYTCKKCNRRYEYNADVGYSRDNICGPFCDGILRGESKSQARITDLEEENKRLRAYVELQPCFCQRGLVNLCDRCKALGKERQ